MADKRKGKRKKEDLPFLKGGENLEKPSKEEFNVAKWLKKNVPLKRTKFLNHNVEYFTGAKAVDALLDSPWSSAASDSEETKFTSRQDVANYLDRMLRHKFFHRAKKVPVSEQELRAKQKKKSEKKDGSKDGGDEATGKELKKRSKGEDEKEKDKETAESSHAEGGKESEGGSTTKQKAAGGEEREKKKRKIRLEMHVDQYFVDGLDAYVWIYDPIPAYYWLCGLLLVLGAIAICMFPLWPPSVRMGVYYLSVATAGFLMLIIALAVLRLVVFCIVWLLTFGVHHLWLFPNLTEDVGFFASFWPLYQYEYKGKEAQKPAGKKRKKEKDSDNEDEKEDDDDDSEEEAEEVEDDQEKRKEVVESKRRKDAKDAKEDDASCDKLATSSATPPPAATTARGGEGDSDTGEEEGDETESEGSSQQSQTGKDFEMVEKSDLQDS